MLAFEMGRALARLYREDRCVTLVPVPLRRDSSRPYNQAERMARGMSTVWGGEVLDGLEWTSSFPSQVGRNSFERRALPRDAFRWSASRIDRPVLLIDDVFTTWTTLMRAAEALKRERISVKGAYCWAVSPVETLSVTWKEETDRV